MSDFSSLSKVKLFISDIDGVMTSGQIWLNENKQWRRAFNVRDGEGIKKLIRNGYQTAVISAGDSEDVRIRMEFLSIHHCFFGVKNKLECFKALIDQLQLKPEECAYIGDDVSDLKILTQVGFAATVPWAVQEVLDQGYYITSHPGGSGAVREICDLILKYGYNSKG